MFRGSTVSTLIGACATILAFAGPAEQGVMAAEPSGSAAAQEWARNNPPSRVEAQGQPVPKDNAQPEVSPEEREAIGLPAPVWTTIENKVHPAVREALEQQKQIIQNDPRMAWAQFDRPAGFEGTAVVDVYLRHQARGEFDSAENKVAIQESQERLLRGLTAAEFSLVFAFKKTAGLVGYVNEAGLAKLSSDPRIVAIGIDDQPRADDLPRVTREPGPKPRPGERARHVERLGKVEAGAYRALEESSEGYLFVLVSLQRAVPLDTPYKQKVVAARDMQERFLSMLSADEFRLRSRGPTGGVHGYTNRAGLDKMGNDEHVVAVDLQEIGTTAGALKRKQP